VIAENEREVCRTMSILITGGTGSIGSFVTRTLVGKGMVPVLYARHKNTPFLNDIEDHIVYVQGDVLDLDKLIETIRTYKIERVIHMAAVMSAPSDANPPMAVRVNVEGTANVLEAAAKCNVKRVVYTSAKGVYSETTEEYGHPTYKPLPEERKRRWAPDL
jgi:UDP-glucose 4-epimerase